MVFQRVIKVGKTLRNHWKKSVFFSGVLTYGVVYLKNYIETRELMRVYCETASKYGRQSIEVTDEPRHITVILNPNANKRKASEDFEKYCAPLLHLAGVYVEIKRTESEGHAKTLIDSIENTTDALVVAGGDGTLSEVVTGLLRKYDVSNSNRLVPIGVLPLGKHNSLANSFFPKGEKLERVRQLADATLAVIEEAVRPADVMKIQSLEEEDEVKPVYALSSLKWGAYRDAEAKKDSYWYFGPLRKYATYVFGGLKSSLTWNCAAVIDYNLPCDGCSNCKRRAPKVQQTSWLRKFIKEDNADAKYLGINNPECQIVHEKKISTSDLAVLTSNVLPTTESSPPKLIVELGDKDVDYFQFVQNGFKLEQGKKKEASETIAARTVCLNPEVKNSWFSIDNEDYEVKPVKITVLPKVLNMFCKKENNVF